ncbi:hypothetical protein EPR50_G00124290 [Perca flavescens]|uniref:Uncharacterized protein n=1 Tax=Perca flavescens TaxID=8167 RepID=A0A484CUD6_PERFV|nr:hypothetical protein EPR50_G00124290 [Perca flavescens]
MYKTWIGQMIYHKKNKNVVQERTATGNLGSMTPISGVQATSNAAASVHSCSLLQENKDHLEPTTQHSQCRCTGQW